jgi:hypothetical protein
MSNGMTLPKLTYSLAIALTFSKTEPAGIVASCAE